LPANPRILRKAGCSSKAWKKLFTAVGDERSRKITALNNLVSDRIKDGRLRNIQEWRVFRAIDLAFDVPFHQTTPTILNNLMGRRFETQDELLAELKNWNIDEDEMFLTVKDEGGKETRVINPPTFYKVLVPLVRSVVTTRCASLFNERNLTPLLKFEPAVSNANTRMLCDMETNITETIARDYGYANTLRQAIFQALMYSFALAFPREVWHSEYQRQEQEDGQDREELEKEGIRYCIPHPTVTSWDLDYNVSDFNTDTGPTWAQYWKVIRYGEILDNKLYWNRRTISFGREDWRTGTFPDNFFEEIYPCHLEWPVPPGGPTSSREQAASYYATNQRDKACFLTDHFMRLIPSKWDLGDYDNYIWVRFVVANDDAIIFAEPCCYPPVLYFGYDADQARIKNASLALEVIPFQDEIGNLLSQILLTCKQNLANVNFYDALVIDDGDIQKIKNFGQQMLYGLNFVRYDSTKNQRLGADVKEAIHSVNFQAKDIQPLFQAIGTTISLMERLLQMSAQEQGATASHQQSKEEVQQTQGSSSNRLKYTGSFVDDGMDAWKRQQYFAQKAYMDTEVETYVSSDITDVEDRLKDLGFEIVSKGDGKINVRGPKSRIKIDALAAAGKGPERKNDTAVAQVMMQTIAPLVKNEKLYEAVGPKLILKIMETAAKLAGADKDFRLKPDQQQEMSQLQQLAAQIQKGAVSQIEKDVTAPVAKEIAQIQQQLKQLQEIVLQMHGKPVAPPQLPAPGQPPVQNAPAPPPNPPTPNAAPTQPPAGAVAPGGPPAPVA
jgi:hypothetical protein